MSLLLIQVVLVVVEIGINCVLCFDGIVLLCLCRFFVKVIEVDCLSLLLWVFILFVGDGLYFVVQYEVEVDCILCVLVGNFLYLVLVCDKICVLYSLEVSMDGDSVVLLELVGILQSLELDWEYELLCWFGLFVIQVFGSGLCDVLCWSVQSLYSLCLNLVDYFVEESCMLVGQYEVEVCFVELDQLKLVFDCFDVCVGCFS